MYEPSNTLILQSIAAAVQKKNEQLAQKEQEIQLIFQQLEQYLLKKLTVETSYTCMNEYHQLKDALQQNNWEVNELLQEIVVHCDYENKTG